MKKTFHQNSPFIFDSKNFGETNMVFKIEFYFIFFWKNRDKENE